MWDWIGDKSILVFHFVSPFVDTTWVYILKIIYSLIIVGYKYLCSGCHLGLYTIQEPSYLGKVTLVLIWW